MEGQGIRGLRLVLGLSQERFARLLGVSFQTVRRWEEGLTRPLPIISLRLEEIRAEVERDQGAGRAEPPARLRSAPAIRRPLPGPPSRRPRMEKREGVDMPKAKGRAAGNPGTPGGPGTEGEPGEGFSGIDIGLGGLFKGVGNLLELVAQMAETGQEQLARSGQVELLGGKGRGVYGFSVRMGLGGKPIIEQFGNVRHTEKGPVVAETREPLVDLLDEGSQLVVIAELPGVEPESIHLEVQGDILELRAEAQDRKYAKDLLLPAAVDAASLQTSYRNGILTARLAKR